MTNTNDNLLSAITDASHAVRNELNIVTGNAYPLTNDPALSAEHRRAAAAIYDAAFRIVDHLDRLMSQARPTKP
jgi:hypothetical protein